MPITYCPTPRAFQTVGLQMNAKILIVDDNPDIRTMLKDRLESLGYRVVTAGDGERALALLDQDSPNLALLDLELPRLSGLEVLKHLSTARQGLLADTPIIMMTAYGTIPTAVEAMKLGAYDFLTKPLDKDHLLIVIRKALDWVAAKRRIAVLESELQCKYARIVGDSPKMKSLLEAAQRAAKSDAGILLLGETGTGKELFARSIHSWSPRQAMPMVAINCSALPEALLESELFGHEKGAFTGADRQKKGQIEMADGGTVFLDEIGDMPLSLQAKLLRVLQDREFHRVGGTRLVSVNIRVIAATNRDLKQAVKAGQFREDLYFRLSVINLTLPPLRERTEDIPALAEFFLERHMRETKRPGMTFSPAAIEAMKRYVWPGNIRELENAIQRAVVLSPTETIEPDVLALSFQDAAASGAHHPALAYVRLPYHESMDAHSSFIIDQALREAQGNQTKAAERLGLQRTYLARLIKQKNLRPDNETEK